MNGCIVSKRMEHRLSRVHNLSRVQFTLVYSRIVTDVERSAVLDPDIFGYVSSFNCGRSRVANCLLEPSKVKLTVPVNGCIVLNMWLYMSEKRGCICLSVWHARFTQHTAPAP